jgi:hypothetical protein
VILTRIMDLICSPQGNGGIYELTLVGDKVNPFLVFGHGDWPISKVVNDTVGIIGLALQDASISVVCFLYLPDNDGLQFTPRIFEVKVCLRMHD